MPLTHSGHPVREKKNRYIRITELPWQLADASPSDVFINLAGAAQ